MKLKHIYLFLILMLVPAWTWGATVYVKDIGGTVYYESGASSCDDVTNGDTAGDLEAALTAAGAGGTLNVCAGTYSESELDADDQIQIPANNITMQAVGTVYIVTTEASRGAIDLDADLGITGTTIDGFIIQNAEGDGIHSGVGTDNDIATEIKNCTFQYIGYSAAGACATSVYNGIRLQEVTNVSAHDNVFDYIRDDGIYGSCTDCQFYNNTFSNLDMDYVGADVSCDGGGSGDCIHLSEEDSTGLDNAKIYDNVCDKSNSDKKTGIIVVDTNQSGSTGVEIYGNTVTSGACGAIKVNGPEDTIVRDNELTNTGTKGANTDGINLWSNGGHAYMNLINNYTNAIELGTSHGIHTIISHNTIVDADVGIKGNDAQCLGINSKGNIIILDSVTGTNILTAHAYTIYNGDNNQYYPNGISAADLYDFHGTDYANLAAFVAGTSQDSNSSASDPLLEASFNLKPGSPSRNTGPPNGTGGWSTSELVPGSNCTSVATEANATTGWTNNGMPTFESSAVDKYEGTWSLHCIADSNSDKVSIPITTVIGENYKFQYALRDKNADADTYLLVRIGTSVDDDSLFSDGTVLPDDWRPNAAFFTATATTTYITLREGGAGNDIEFYFDSSTAVVETGIYSSAIQDLNSNTITDASGDALPRFGDNLDIGAYEHKQMGNSLW